MSRRDHIYQFVPSDWVEPSGPQREMIRTETESEDETGPRCRHNVGYKFIEVQFLELLIEDICSIVGDREE